MTGPQPPYGSEQGEGGRAQDAPGGGGAPYQGQQTPAWTEPERGSGLGETSWFGESSQDATMRTPRESDAGVYRAPVSQPAQASERAPGEGSDQARPQVSPYVDAPTLAAPPPFAGQPADEAASTADRSLSEPKDAPSSPPSPSTASSLELSEQPGPGEPHGESPPRPSADVVGGAQPPRAEATQVISSALEPSQPTAGEPDRGDATQVVPSSTTSGSEATQIVPPGSMTPAGPQTPGGGVPTGPGGFPPPQGPPPGQWQPGGFPPPPPGAAPPPPPSPGGGYPPPMAAPQPGQHAPAGPYPGQGWPPAGQPGPGPGGFGGPPPHHPPPQQAWAGPPPQQQWGAPAPPPPQQQWGGPPPQQQWGAPQPYGAPQQWGAPQPYPPGGYGQAVRPEQLADWGPRALGGLIDYFAGFAIAYLVIFIGGGAQSAVLVLIGYLLLLGALGFALYNSYQGGVTGQSIGKKVAKIKLVKAETGQPIGGGYGLLRYLAHAIEVGIGWFAPLFTPKKQTFADMIMNTVVVKAE